MLAMDFRKKLYDNFLNYRNEISICVNDRAYSYEEFFFRICDLYNYINSYRANSLISRIGIVCNNDVDTYSAILACWFSGVSYVPLNPVFPLERNLIIINESHSELIFDSTGKFCEYNLQTPVKATSEIEAESLFFELINLTDSDELYVLFTSGSTGIPKGVPIVVKNISSFIEAFERLNFRINKEDKFLQMFDLTFDVSVASFLIPLLYGASFYTVDSKKIKYLEVYRIIKQYSISIATIVPSIINLLKPYLNEILLPSIRYCILTAEATVINELNHFRKAIPNALVVNLYGPTEVTIWCTSYFYDHLNPKAYNGMMAIGSPFYGIESIIIDDEGNLQKEGFKGELALSGDQVTGGYLNNFEKNNTSFIQYGGKRYYKTGDLVFEDETGILFYCGRIDTQVKIQGFRIELSEIEISIREAFDVNNFATVIVSENGISEIVSFIEDSELTLQQIKFELEKRLPYYMIPSKVICLKEFPINSSGKFDKLELRKIASSGN